MTDDEAIAEYIRKRGVRKLPTRCARLLGETNQAFVMPLRPDDFARRQQELRDRLMPGSKPHVVR